MRHWKTLLALLIMAALTLGTALAETTDPATALSAWKANADTYNVTIYDESAAWLSSALSAASRSFTHKYESATRYSSTKFFLNFFDYNSSSFHVEPELMLSYSRDDQPLNITSVTVIIGDTAYTFSGEMGYSVDSDDDGYVEYMHFYMDANSYPFIVGVMNYIAEAGVDALQNDRVKGTLILHGDEDVQCELGVGFFLDFYVVCATTLDEFDYIGYIPSSNSACVTMYTSDVG